MGFFQDISARFAAMRQRSKDKKSISAALLAAAEDGKLTDDELHQIQRQQAELGLTADDLRKVRVQAYKAAFAAVRRDGKVTAEEEAELDRLQAALAIPDDSLSKSKRELAHLRFLTEIQSGNLPAMEIRNVILQRGEVGHWSEPGSILEEQVVGRRYVGSSQGVSIRIAKGISYRVGSQRGRLIIDKSVRPVSSGDLIFTNKRIIFRGDAKSFSVRLDKLLEVHFHSDGIRLTDDKGKPRVVKFRSARNMEIVGAVLSGAINHYGA